MREIVRPAILGLVLAAGAARGDDRADTGPVQTGGSKPGAAASDAKSAEEAKLLAAVREALERNSREIKDLKERYAKDMAEQRKLVEAQQKQIVTLEQTSRSLRDQLGKIAGGDRGQKLQEIQSKQLGVLEEQSRLTAEQLKKQAPALEKGLGAAAAPTSLPAGGQPGKLAEGDRQRKLLEIQGKQLDVLEEQSRLVADQVEKQGPAVEKLETQTATLASRSKQAALRDKEVADSLDTLRDSVDSGRRDALPLPASLKELFIPSGSYVSPLTIYNTISTRYDILQGTRGAGNFSFEEFTPFFLYQLNNRILLSAETSFNQGGVALGQAQADIFINNWLTADIGYFLAPIGFWSERLDPRWINKLPDIPLVMRQVIPDGLTMTGLQFRGAKYINRSPWKLEYSAYMTNGLGVPGAGAAADWYDLGGVTGTTGGVNQAMAYGGRIGLWLPSRGINFGVSDFVNAPYSRTSGAVMNIWQPYFNYHRGNWDARFEYGDNFERTKPFIGNNIDRTGLYAQVAYRDYASIEKHRQRLEYVFRFSNSIFHGIDQAHLDPSTYSSPVNAPLNRNQYTIGLNYYLYASSILKFAYEINTETGSSLRDNVFMIQFATNF
ncbi:MAG: hypothetical protein KGM43_17930 [Planctomycetota bacterium]|nr:hypothetical protein [Planctomycetota bacterium]